MPRFIIWRLDDGAEPPPSIPGVRCCLNIPDLPANVRSNQEVLRWFIRRPDLVADLVFSLWPLVDGPTQPLKPFEKPYPPPA